MLEVRRRVFISSNCSAGECRFICGGGQWVDIMLQYLPVLVILVV